MKYFGTQTYYSLDKSKPYQRPELRHAGPTSVNREAELERPSRVACSDLILPVKPFWFFVIIWVTGGEVRPTLPRVNR
jgi:hypothetical protein